MDTYEKKYNEALEQAKKELAVFVSMDCYAARLIIRLFPELGESEDERMRKRAIAILKQQRDYWSYDGPIDKFPPATPRKDLVDAIDVALSYLEEQKEQKPWSEEDENAMKYLHELISFGFVEKFFDAQTAADMRKWLNTRFKSLRPKPHWKPSEEQKEPEYYQHFDPDC